MDIVWELWLQCKTAIRNRKKSSPVDALADLMDIREHVRWMVDQGNEKCLYAATPRREPKALVLQSAYLANAIKKFQDYES